MTALMANGRGEFERFGCKPFHSLINYNWQIGFRFLKRSKVILKKF